MWRIVFKKPTAPNQAQCLSACADYRYAIFGQQGEDDHFEHTVANCYCISGEQFSTNRFFLYLG